MIHNRYELLTPGIENRIELISGQCVQLHEGLTNVQKSLVWDNRRISSLNDEIVEQIIKNRILTNEVKNLKLRIEGLEVIAKNSLLEIGIIKSTLRFFKGTQTRVSRTINRLMNRLNKEDIELILLEN